MATIDLHKIYIHDTDEIRYHTFYQTNNISFNNHYPHSRKTINDGNRLVNTNNMYLYIQEIQKDNGIYTVKNVTYLF